jgi:uncharacterized protein
MHEQSPELKRGGRIGPVGESKRVAAMDVIRGVALFGILAVNMDFFAGPFAAMFSDETAWTVSGLDAAAFWTVATVFQGKFSSLFSFLFGAGIALQLLRLDETRGGMAANLLLLRRLFVLGAFGLIHATLIWYGDILFIYATLGWVLLLLRYLPHRVVGWLGVAMLVVAMGCMAGFGLLMASKTAMMEAAQTPSALVAEDGAPAADNAASDHGASDDGASDDAASDDAEVLAEESVIPVPDGPTSFELFKEFGAETSWSVVDPRWEPFELATYRHGPTEVAVTLRAFQWASTVPVMYILYGPHLLCLFCFGMYAARAGLLREEHARLQRTLAWIGIPIGLALSAIVPSMRMMGWSQTDPLVAGLGAVQELGTVLLALGYAGALARVAYAGPLALAAFLGQTGRMAFTIYLSMSVLMTGLFYWWGFGLFDTVGHAGRFAIAVVTWLALSVAAQLWMRAFVMGPLEWIWRTLSYLRIPPLRRVAGESSGGAGASEG